MIAERSPLQLGGLFRKSNCSFGYQKATFEERGRVLLPGVDFDSLSTNQAKEF